MSAELKAIVGVGVLIVTAFALIFTSMGRIENRLLLQMGQMETRLTSRIERVEDHVCLLEEQGREVLQRLTRVEVLVGGTGQ